MTLDILSKFKIKVPKEIALIGFTNSVCAGIFNPSLAAVVQPAFEMGALAAQMLIQIIESKRPVTDFETKILDIQLINNKTSTGIKRQNKNLSYLFIYWISNRKFLSLKLRLAVMLVKSTLFFKLLNVKLH